MSDRRRTRAWLAVASIIAAAALVLWLGRDNPSGRGASARDQRDPSTGQAASSRARPVRSLPSTAADVRLAGRVVDLSGVGVADAEVRLASHAITTTVATDDNGDFAFDAIPPGVYFVDAASEDAACLPRRVHLNADTPPLLLRLSAAIRAVVTVLDRADRRPISGAVVEVMDLHGDTPFRSGVTDEAGNVALRGMPPDGYAVTVSAQGYRTTLEPFPGRAGLDWSMTVMLASGVEVRGRVTDEEGAPVAAAAIMPLPTAEALFVATPKLASHSVTSNDRGEFAITLDAGDFRLVATHPRYLHGSSEAFAVDGKSAVEGIEIRVEAGGAIAGKVVARDGSGVAFATVRSSAALRRDLGTGLRETRADADGRFLIEGLPLVPIELVASSADASSDNVEVDLAAASPAVDVILTLEFDAVIAGVVTDSDGNPIEDVQVFCVGLPVGAVGTRPIFAETSDASGRFTCRGLVPGDYSLTATRPFPNNNQGPSMRSVSVQGVMTGTGDVAIVLPADGSLTGQVRLLDGSTPASFGVSVDSGGLPRRFENAVDGRFVMDGLSPRTYSVRVSAEGFIPRIVGPVQVPEGGQVDLGLITLAPAMAPPVR